MACVWIYCPAVLAFHDTMVMSKGGGWEVVWSVQYPIMTLWPCGGTLLGWVVRIFFSFLTAVFV